MTFTVQLQSPVSQATNTWRFFHTGCGNARHGAVRRGAMRDAPCRAVPDPVWTNLKTMPNFSIADCVNHVGSCDLGLSHNGLVCCPC